MPSTMHSTMHSIRQERLSELVTQLSGAPLEQARSLLADAKDRNLDTDDFLGDVAGALVAIRSLAV